MLKSLLTPAALLAAASFATAQITPIATETFQYTFPGLLDGQGGGAGFSNNWFVTNGNDIVIFDPSVNPPFALSDGVGQYAGQANVFGEAYRRFDTAQHPDIVDNGKYGADGATVWISFSTVNFQGQAVDHYGGLSLFNVGVGEVLYLGSPWNTNAWGIDDQGPNGAPAVTIPGTSDTVASRLVTRIDFMPGMERLRMWVNPATSHPTTAADLDTMIADLRFDEMRLASGGNNGDLYFWDNLVFEKGTPAAAIGTNYCLALANSTGATGAISATGSTSVAANDVTLTAASLPTNAFGYFLTSLTQQVVVLPGGSQGNLCLGGAIGRYVGPGQVQNSGATGSFSLALDLTATPTPNGLVAVAAGETWNFQAWHRDSVGGNATSNFTDGLSVSFN